LINWRKTFHISGVGEGWFGQLRLDFALEVERAVRAWRSTHAAVMAGESSLLSFPWDEIASPVAVSASGVLDGDKSASLKDA
jgi:hypothetical protein